MDLIYLIVFVFSDSLHLSKFDTLPCTFSPGSTRNKWERRVVQDDATSSRLKITFNAVTVIQQNYHESHLGNNDVWIQTFPDNYKIFTQEAKHGALPSFTTTRSFQS